MRTRLAQLIVMAIVAIGSVAQEPPGPESLLQQGVSLVQRGEYTQAIPLLTKAVGLDPQNPPANYQLGVALFESGHASEAVPRLRSAIAMDPANEAARGYLGDAEMRIREFSGAAQAFATAIDRSPSSEQALVWWTDFCLERYRTLDLALRTTVRGRAAVLEVGARDATMAPDKRQELLTLAVKLDPLLPGIRGELGAAQVTDGKIAEATANLAIAVKNEPDSLSTLELEVLIAASEGNWDNARENLVEINLRSPAELKRLATVWPQKMLPAASAGASSASNIWACLRSSGASCSLSPAPRPKQETMTAEQLFKEGRWEQLSSAPDPRAEDIRAWFMLGAALAAMGDCRRAIVPLERGIDAGAEVGGASLADCYKREAIHTADRLQTLGKEASVHQIRGDILLSLRLDAERAVAEYEQALNLKPDDGPLLEKLAEGYFSEGDMAKARQTANRALTLNPHRTRLLRMLAEIEMNDRNYDAALSVLKPLSELEPDDGWIMVQQGIAYMHTDEAKSAVEKLQSALNHGYPDEKGALHQMLAMQLRKLDRIDEAKQAAAEAVRLADLFAEQHSAKPASQTTP